MEDKREHRYKEFVEFFSTTVAQKGEHKLADESVFVYELLPLSIWSKCNQSRCVHYFSLFFIILCEAEEDREEGVFLRVSAGWENSS